MQTHINQLHDRLIDAAIRAFNRLENQQINEEKIITDFVCLWNVYAPPDEQITFKGQFNQ